MISKDRQRGTLLGLAIGDALGAAVEFEPPGAFPEVTGFRGGGPHGLEPGEWTDDTSLALALADSIAEVGWDIGDQAERYLAWWRTGFTAIAAALALGRVVPALIHNGTRWPYVVVGLGFAFYGIALILFGTRRIHRLNEELGVAGPDRADIDD